MFDNYRALRWGDVVSCLSKFQAPQDVICPKQGCVPGSVQGGSMKTFIEGRRAARATDKTSNCRVCGLPVAYIKTGSTKNLFENLPAARKGDRILCGIALTAAYKTFIGN